jgi:hypothetical protein
MNGGAVQYQNDKEFETTVEQDLAARLMYNVTLSFISS